MIWFNNSKILKSWTFQILSHKCIIYENAQNLVHKSYFLWHSKTLFSEGMIKLFNGLSRLWNHRRNHELMINYFRLITYFRIDVVCSRGEFAYLVHTHTYCEVKEKSVTCLAFQQASDWWMIFIHFLLLFLKISRISVKWIIDYNNNNFIIFFPLFVDFDDNKWENNIYSGRLAGRIPISRLSSFSFSISPSLPPCRCAFTFYLPRFSSSPLRQSRTDTGFKRDLLLTLSCLLHWWKTIEIVTSCLSLRIICRLVVWHQAVVLHNPPFMNFTIFRFQ